jgi:hypothetical protein
MSVDRRLEDLAVLYVGLAHGVDGRFHFHEFTQIAAHLERWRSADDDRVILDLVDEVVRTWDAVRVIEALEVLRDALTPLEKNSVLSDLHEIAHADRRYLKEEAEYIARVAYDWGVGS